MKKKFWLNEMMPLALGVCLMTTLVSCGSSDDDDSGTGSGNPPQQEEVQQEGTFSAVLSPENASVIEAAGRAEIKIEGDEFNAKVIMANASDTTHAQHIHSGTRCPALPADDTNNDGVIDSVEATAVYGPPILPLDSDLSSNTGNFPQGPIYNYNEDASLSQMLGNLNLPVLNVEGLVVNVHGIPDDMELPATAQGPKAEFPISCGLLQRIDGGGTTGETTGGTTGGETTGGTTGGETTGGTTGGETTGGTTGGETTGGTTGGETTGGTTGGI